MAMLATNLSRTYNSALGKNVIDGTGLTGTFDIHLKWAIDASASPSAPGSASPPDATGPSIFTALQETLGLRLVPGKVSAEVLVIDRAEKPSAN